MEYALPIILFTVLAVVAGAVLTYLSHKFPGESTDTELKVREALPGLNCGMCGFAGCDEYAKKAATGNIAPNMCVPGGAKTAAAVSAVTGVAYDAVVEMAAYVRCRGNYNATRDKYDYRGVQTCAASAQFYGGRSSCRDGCLGFGDCAAVCPNGAITVENGCASIDRTKCTGCLLCSRACPKKLIIGVPRTAKVAVTCHSRTAAKETRQTCTNGCIACRRCEKACPNGAITVNENFAEIDYTKCSSCGKCAEVCAFGVIKKL